jgi:hypothetical protein
VIRDAVQPLVSIVTPSFNQGRFIRNAIDSVLAQDAGIPSIINVPLYDPDEAAAVLGRLNTLPEERLLAIQAENWRLLDEHYNWARFADQVIAAIESAASPPLDPESRSRRIMFVYNEQRSPHGPLRTGLRRVFRKRGRVFRKGASAVQRVRRRPGVGHTSRGSQK